jgi:hypothetical protein
MVSGEAVGCSGTDERARRKVVAEGSSACHWAAFNRRGGRNGGGGVRARGHEMDRGGVTNTRRGGRVGAVTSARAWQGHACGEGSGTGR